MKTTNFRLVVSAADNVTPTPTSDTTPTPTSDPTPTPTSDTTPTHTPSQDSDLSLPVPSTGSVVVPNTGYLSDNSEADMMQGGFNVGVVALIVFIVAALACLVTFLIRCKKKSKVGFGTMSRRASVGMYSSVAVLVLLAICGVGKVISVVSNEVNATDFDAFSVDSTVEVSLKLDKENPVRACGSGSVVINQDLPDGYIVNMQASDLRLTSDNPTEVPSISTAGDLGENTWGYKIKNDNIISPVPIADLASIKDIETATQSGDTTDVDFCVMLGPDTVVGTYESNVSYEVEPHVKETESIGETINRVAISLSWSDSGHDPWTGVKPEYKTALAETGVNKLGDSCSMNGNSCDAFIATVLRYSKADENFPCCTVSTQYSYLTSHPELYEEIPNIGSAENMQPGDIRIKPGQHIEMYVVLENGKGMIASASHCDRTADHASAYYADSGYKIYRKK